MTKYIIEILVVRTQVLHDRGRDSAPIFQLSNADGAAHQALPYVAAQVSVDMRAILKLDTLAGLQILREFTSQGLGGEGMQLLDPQTI